MNADSANTPIVLTCAQPTGQLHLGNYLGAVRNWLTFLDDHECYFGIVDQHAITMPYKPAELRQNTRDLMAQYIACGLEPDRCKLFVQSHVTGHTELAWVLGCITPLGQLQRMTQFKDKSGKASQESIGAGLLFYPVLMAADILLYNADVVPVGEDQVQHLELTRDLAEKFNRVYSDTFTVPEYRLSKQAARVMSLADPTRKMSKSDPNPNGILYLLDPPQTLRKKIKSAVTDTGNEILARDDKPGITNLLNIMSAATGKTIAELEAEFKDAPGYAPFKEAVAEAVVEMLTPVQERYQQIVNDKGFLEATMKDGAEAAQKRAYKVLGKVYRKAGFVERTR